MPGSSPQPPLPSHPLRPDCLKISESRNALLQQTAKELGSYSLLFWYCEPERLKTYWPGGLSTSRWSCTGSSLSLKIFPDAVTLDCEDVRLFDCVYYCCFLCVCVFSTHSRWLCTDKADCTQVIWFPLINHKLLRMYDFFLFDFCVGSVVTMSDTSNILVYGASCTNTKYLVLMAVRWMRDQERRYQGFSEGQTGSCPVPFVKFYF